MSLVENVARSYGRNFNCPQVPVFWGGAGFLLLAHTDSVQLQHLCHTLSSSHGGEFRFYHFSITPIAKKAEGLWNIWCVYVEVVHFFLCQEEQV